MGLSQDFLEKPILLLLIGRLREKKEFDAQQLQEQKEFEANLVRGNKVLEAQIALIENLSNLLWELQLFSLAVSYYKVHPDQERFDSDLKNYDEKSWGLFKNIRCEIGQANYLTFQQQYQSLSTFFDDNLIRQVYEKLMPLIEKNSSLEKWSKHYHWKLYIFPKGIDRIVTPLTEELKLASPHSTL